jgi:CheY-like chemotaxis protein
MLDTELTPKQQHYAERIKQSGDALLGLINHILDLAKIEAGHTVIEQTDFHLPKLLDEAMTLFDSQCREKGIRFRLSIAPQLPMVLKGDHGRIRQVLFNLIGNAIKFTEHGSIAVAVDQEDRDDDGFLLAIKVKDTGIGIPQGVQDSLFEKFTQADASTTRKYGGTGLGLAICKELVELMGGSIGLESAPGCGSTFWFTVRCRPGKLAPLIKSAPNTDNREIGTLPDDLADMGLRVLLAEDNPVNQEITTTVLEAAGISVDAVGDGFEAVQAVQDFPYDVVLMDIQMPEMDGPTATHLIRGLPGSIATLPIIALTADAMNGNREKFLSAGFDDYLTKPFEPADLYAAILRHISRDDDALSLNG